MEPQCFAGRLRSGRPIAAIAYSETGVAVHVSRLRHAYGTTSVLRGVDLELRAGEHVAVMGPSGAGKSTLLSLLGGLEPLQEGSIAVGAQDLSRLSRPELARYRRSTIGFVFQHFGLLDALSAQENVELAMALSGLRASQRKQRAGELLDQVGLAGRTHHRPGALSGGERQRVAIARSLANHPRLVLADEPTGNLDEEAAARILDLLEAVRRQHGCTLVVVTHNREVARRADRQLLLSHGLFQ